MIKNQDDKHRYDDIINLPHHVSKTHKHMSNLDRAAQFAPFAALSGHEEAVKETARLTDEKMLLDESQIQVLDHRLQIIIDNLKLKQPVSITYFKPDSKKNGGTYETVNKVVKNIDTYENVVAFEDKTKIKIDDICCIEAEMFNQFEF